MWLSSVLGGFQRATGYAKKEDVGSEVNDFSSTTLPRCHMRRVNIRRAARAKRSIPIKPTSCGGRHRHSSSISPPSNISTTLYIASQISRDPKTPPKTTAPAQNVLRRQPKPRMYVSPPTHHPTQKLTPPSSPTNNLAPHRRPNLRGRPRIPTLHHPPLRHPLPPDREPLPPLHPTRPARHEARNRTRTRAGARLTPRNRGWV